VENDFKDLFPDWEPRESRGFGEAVPEEVENRISRPLNEKEVKVLGVYGRTSPGILDPQTFVVLQDNNGRKVCIYIGRYEAMAISQALDGDEADRPLTYDLMTLVIDKLGATVDRVLVDDIWQDTYYAKLSLTKNGDYIDIDCRPSDAINVALRRRAPIYMAEAVIEASQIDV
jgi:bifunctional DNase/RNase